MHNDGQSDIHSTDAFGYTAIRHQPFGGFRTPPFKNLKRQRLYIFRSRQSWIVRVEN